MINSSITKGIPVEFEKLWKELENRVMADVIERIAINDEITRSSDWQMHQLIQYGESSEFINNELQRLLKTSKEKIDELYSGIIKEAYAADSDMYKACGVAQTPFEKNFPLQNLIASVSEQTNESFKNISGSLGFAEKVNGETKFKPIAEFYQNQIDSALLDAISGTFDYNSAIKRCIENMTKSGLRTVDYASGWTNRIDVAVRRAVMTGVNQVTSYMSERVAEELKTDYFEVEAHHGARPAHQLWQGKVYTKQKLIDICGLGEVTGLKGANCYHSYWPFIPKVMERQWADEELDVMNDEDNTPKDYYGKKYTAYEATQHQRSLETRMRAIRQRIHLAQKGNLEANIQLDYQLKYRRLRAEYVDFSKEFGLPEQMQNVYRDGLKDIGARGRMPKAALHNKPAAQVAARNTGKELYFNDQAAYAVNNTEYNSEIELKISNACKEVAYAGSKSRIEHLSLINLKTGEKVFADIGTETEVGGDKYRDFLKNYEGENLAFIHNHNIDGWLSQQDMQTLLSSPKIDVMIAVRNDGVIYYAPKSSGSNRHLESIYLNEINILRQECKNSSTRNFTIEREELVVKRAIEDYCKGYKEYE